MLEQLVKSRHVRLELCLGRPHAFVKQVPCNGPNQLHSNGPNGSQTRPLQRTQWFTNRSPPTDPMVHKHRSLAMDPMVHKQVPSNGPNGSQTCPLQRTQWFTNQSPTTNLTVHKPDPCNGLNGSHFTIISVTTNPTVHRCTVESFSTRFGCSLT